MKEAIKLALKASVALFAVGIATKLGKDALEHAKQIKSHKQDHNGQ